MFSLAFQNFTNLNHLLLFRVRNLNIKFKGSLKIRHHTAACPFDNTPSHARTTSSTALEACRPFSSVQHLRRRTLGSTHSKSKARRANTCVKNRLHEAVAPGPGGYVSKGESTKCKAHGDNQPKRQCHTDDRYCAAKNGYCAAKSRCHDMNDNGSTSSYIRVRASRLSGDTADCSESEL